MTRDLSDHGFLSSSLRYAKSSENAFEVRMIQNKHQIIYLDITLFTSVLKLNWFQQGDFLDIGEKLSQFFVSF